MSIARRGGGVIALALIGTALATVGDANHARTGTLRYRHPWHFGQAWWVAPLFFVAFAALGGSYRIAAGLGAAGWARRSAAPGQFGPFAVAAAIFFLAYLASGFGHGHPAVLCVLSGCCSYCGG